MKQALKKIIKSNKLLNIIALKYSPKRRIKKKILGNYNVIANKGSTVNVICEITGDNNVIEIMEGAILSNMKIYIQGNNHKLVIENNCSYKGGSIWFEDYNCYIHIGRNTSIESAHFAVTEPFSEIFIGEDCMFSHDIEIRTGDSHSIIDAETHNRINRAKSIKISDHVWIGARAIILKGVSIDKNSIIGTGAIVTKNIPAHSLAAGIPAVVIRNNVDWLRERI